MKTIQTLITTVCILTTPLLFAQTSQWQLADGTEGRAVYDIEFYESDRDTLYATSYHALLISTDRGASWDSVTSVPAAGAVIEIDPFDSKRILLSHTTLLPPFFEDFGTEVLMTEDGGINWESIFLGEHYVIDYPIIENDPGDPHTVYIDVTPNRFYRSSDYGHTWDSIPSPDIEFPGRDEPGYGRIYSLTIAPSNNNIIYTSYFNLATYLNNIYKSTDRGQTWAQVPLPSIFTYMTIAVHPENPDIVYFSVGAWGVYKSNDGGENWAQKNNGIEALVGLNWINTIAIHPKEPETLYLGVSSSVANGYNPILYRSVDGAESWIPFNAGLLDTIDSNRSVNTLAIDTLNHRIYAGTNRGIYVRDFELNIDDNDVQLPQTFSLEQNYPNPFNAVTTIPYTLLEASLVNLTLYDISGRRVKTLIDDTVPAGIYKTELSAENLPSGIYIYRLKIGTEAIMRKAILMK